MSRWIALATYNEQGEREEHIGDLDNLDKVEVFLAVGDEPTNEEIVAAFEGWNLPTEQELILLPIDAGKTVILQTTVTVATDVLARVEGVD